MIGDLIAAIIEFALDRLGGRKAKGGILRIIYRASWALIGVVGGLALVGTVWSMVRQGDTGIDTRCLVTLGCILAVAIGLMVIRARKGSPEGGQQLEESHE